MKIKKQFYFFSSIIVLLPLFGSIHLFILGNSYEENYKSNSDNNEIIELIEKSKNIESLRDAAMRTFKSRERIINEKILYMNLFSQCLFLIFFINFIFLLLLYKEKNKGSP